MLPDERGYFGEFGGQWVAETLVPAIHEIRDAFKEAQKDAGFWRELGHWNQHYGGRPTPLYQARRLGDAYGATVLLKREDLVHGGAHKFNNVMGQALLAKRMGKTHIIAETGAGQHGVATAMAGAALGIPVTVFMGEKDVARQEQNVFRMRLFGAKVCPVTSGNGTLKDAVNQTLREWAGDPAAYYCVGSVVGPHPFPLMVREFQKVIGHEARKQCQEQADGLPDAVVACVGGGSNALGIFHAFRDDDVRLIGVEAGGHGLASGEHAATLAAGGSPGILHGMLSVLFQDADGQIIEPHSISAGLDYPGVGPEHAHLAATGRVTYTSATDAEALAATQDLCRLEGILPALESAHALAAARQVAQDSEGKPTILVNLSGRGDKDIHTIQTALGEAL